VKGGILKLKKMRVLDKTNKTTENLKEWITQFFKNEALAFEGDVYWSGNDLVINGKFFGVRQLEFMMEFRFDKNWAVPENGVDSLRLTKFDQLSGVPMGT